MKEVITNLSKVGYAYLANFLFKISNPTTSVLDVGYPILIQVVPQKFLRDEFEYDHLMMFFNTSYQWSEEEFKDMVGPYMLNPIYFTSSEVGTVEIRPNPDQEPIIKPCYTVRSILELHPFIEHMAKENPLYTGLDWILENILIEPLDNWIDSSKLN